MEKVSIVIPCFNEEDNVAVTLDRVNRFFEENLSDRYELELMPVDDGSFDKTKTILNELVEKNSSLKPVYHPRNMGRGAAMKSGIANCTGDYLIFLDADLSYDVDHIQEIMATFSGELRPDAVIVSPYMKGGVAKNIPLSRLLLSRCANWVLSGFFSKNISTVTSMVRGYRAEVIKKIPLHEDGKEIHLEILRKLILLDYFVEEIPGRLIWKEKKERGKRLNKKKVAGAATNHLFYGVLTKPTRLLTKVSLLLLCFGLYESLVIAYTTMQNFQAHGHFWRDLWLALSQSFANSPHSFLLAGLSLVLSAQSISFLVLFSILKMQHEEILKHLIRSSKHGGE